MTDNEFINTGQVKVRFQGEEYFFFGKDAGSDNAALATKEQAENGYCSYAHAFCREHGDHGVLRFQQKIGTLAEIEIIGDDKELEIIDDAFLNMSTHPTWPCWRN